MADYYSEIGDSSDHHEKRQGWVKWAIRLSMVVNLLLLTGKLIAFLASKSKAILASFADSIVDIASQVVVFFCNWNTNHIDDRYPIGKTKLETIGALIIACIMTFASVEVIQTSVDELYQGFAKNNPKYLDMTALLYGILISAVFLKFFLFIMCYYLRKDSDSTMVLAADHLNDIISNCAAIAFAGFSTVDSTKYWYIDPVGGITISLYIIFSWLRLAKQQIEKIVGLGAPDEFIEKIHKISVDYDHELEVDSIRAYHFGTKYFVEIDIVLPGHKSVFETHDKALGLQQLIERENQVERAFVHIDYIKRESPEHKLDWSKPFTLMTTSPLLPQ